MVLIPADFSKFHSPELARNKSIQDFEQMQDALRFRDYKVKPQPQFDYARQAQKLQQQAANINSQSAQNAVTNASGTIFGSSGNVNVGMGGASPRLAAVLRALRTQESGGRYSAVNSSSGAMGAYQIMPSNILGSGGWDQEALGRNVSQQQFMNSPQIQNAIARYKFGNYMRQYGVRGALASWYSGQPNWRNDAPQNGGPSIHDYVMHVLSLMR